MHTLNILVHIGTGAIAILLGLWLQMNMKGTGVHRKLGRIFVAFTAVVCITATIGNAVFRFMPLFAVLTVLVFYQLLSGWHVIYTKAAGPNRVDVLLCVVAAVWTLGLVPLVLDARALESAPVVIYSTLAALFVLIAYDAARWIFPKHWHGVLWRYEHIYKIVASLYAMLSAAAGNLLPQAQPWSQLVPSALGIATIGWFFWRESRRAVEKHRVLGQDQIVCKVNTARVAALQAHGQCDET